MGIDFCSFVCYNRGMKDKIYVCKECSHEFTPYVRRQIYCSPKCSRAGRSKGSAKRAADYRDRHTHPCDKCGKPIIRHTSLYCVSCCRTGELSKVWKGGRLERNGYIILLHPSHHGANKRGYVREHLVIWEQANGKDLPTGWVIHHLNGIKSDNRPSNLVALSTKKHYLVIQAKAKRIQELESQLAHQSPML